MLTMFRDACRVGTEARTASGVEWTTGQKRIDFVFYRGDRLRLDGIQTVETAPWFGKPASDHRPLVAVFREQPVVK
jgi:endonuclease/exonuclease/phosphatase (EEP) superfamily protein YafD